MGMRENKKDWENPGKQEWGGYGKVLNVKINSLFYNYYEILYIYSIIKWGGNYES